MPAKELLPGQGLFAIPGVVQVHQVPALNVPVSGGDAAFAHTDLPGYGGADHPGVEELALDRAAPDHARCEGLKGDLPLNLKGQELRPVQEAFLKPADPAEEGDERALSRNDGGPVRPLV